MAQPKKPKKQILSVKAEASSLLPGQEALRPLYLRVPSSFYDDVQNIANLSGLSINAACIDLLRPAIKAKLRQLLEE